MISAETVSAIAQEVETTGLSEQSLSSLRAHHPELHFTYCMDDDIGVVEPYLQAQGFNVYLVDGREHCLKFTGSLEAATGLVLAEVLDDD